MGNFSSNRGKGGGGKQISKITFVIGAIDAPPLFESNESLMDRTMRIHSMSVSYGSILLLLLIRILVRILFWERNEG